MMEEANARAAAAEAEAAQYRSREVFREAGLDPANKAHAAIMRGYDGATEPDAVKAFVADLGLNAEPTPPPQVDPAGADEQAAQQRIADAARGDGRPPPEPDAREKARVALETAARNRNIPPEELARLGKEYSRAGGFPVKEDWE